MALRAMLEEAGVVLEEAGIVLEINALDRAARLGVQNDPTVWDIAEYSDVVTDFTTHFWSNLFNEDNYPGQDTQGFTQDPELQRLLKAAMADRREEKPQSAVSCTERGSERSRANPKERLQYLAAGTAGAAAPQGAGYGTVTGRAAG